MFLDKKRYYMKYFIFFLLTFCVFALGTNIQAQDKVFKIQCIYKLDYQPDSTDKTSAKSENMLLLIDGGNSVFKSQNKNVIDSIDLIPFGTGDLNGMLKLMNSNRANFRFTITKDSTSEVRYMDYIDINVYEYTEPKNSFKWEISGDSATLNGYHCQKATTIYGGRRWTAWFTNEIPISEGPYKFGGLPGLIIKTNDDSNYYTFTLTELLNKSCALYNTQKHIEKISKEKYNSSLEYYLDNRFEMMALRGVKVTSGEASIRQRMADQRKKNNNPIELFLVKKE